MLVKDIMTKNVVTIDSEKTVYDACLKYKEKGVGCLVVMKNNVVSGIITERDMIERVILGEKKPKETKVEEIMTKNIKMIHASAKIEQAAEMMTENHIKRLPVLLNNEISGIITITDIANIMPDLSRKLIEENESFKFVKQTY